MANNGKRSQIEPAKLFGAQASSYARYISLFGYPAGLQAAFAAMEGLESAKLEGLRVMDAGSGTGVVTLSFLKAMHRNGYKVESVNGFDLTPAMLALFQASLVAEQIKNVELCQCNVMELEKLPSHWQDYDLIISASMLEYIPQDRFVETLNGLRSRLKADGRFILFITRRNWLTRLLVENPWGGNRYRRAELATLLAMAGFKDIAFSRFPWQYGWLNLWGHIVTAQKG